MPEEKIKPDSVFVKTLFQIWIVIVGVVWFPLQSESCPEWIKAIWCVVTAPFVIFATAVTTSILWVVVMLNQLLGGG